MKKILTAIIAALLITGFPCIAEASDPFTQGYIAGKLKNIIVQPATEVLPQSLIIIQIDDYDGKQFEFLAHAHVAFSIDQLPVKVNAFRKGMEVYATLQDNLIISLEGFSSISPGFIGFEEKCRWGTIQKIDRDNLDIIQDSGEIFSGRINPATIVTHQGQVTGIDQLYVGDRVKLFFEQDEYSPVTRIEAEGSSVVIQGIYRGTLDVVDFPGNRIGFKNLKQLKNGKWSDIDKLVNLPIQSDTLIYFAEHKIPFQNLKYYKGKRAYLITRNLYGQDQIVRMIIQSGNENLYTDQIDDFNIFSAALELANTHNINLHEGTIILRNGRLVDRQALSAGIDVTVIGSGENRNCIAEIINILNSEVNASNIGGYWICAGKLEDIYDDVLWLDSYYLLDKNEWQSDSGEIEFYFDDDTGIYDAKADKVISKEEFISGNYAVDENSDYVKENNLEDYFAYMYVQGDRVAAIMLQEDSDSLNRQRITSGTVKEIAENHRLGWTVNLSEVRNWSSSSEKWRLSSANQQLLLDKALIIKNKQIINVDDLMVGDNLYIVREDLYCKIVLVK